MYFRRHTVAVIVMVVGLLQTALAQDDLFRRENLVAWCIVPFDSQHRTPEQRAEMLVKLGIHQLAGCDVRLLWCASDWWVRTGRWRN